MAPKACKSIFREGGLTIGQDEATCTVYGMPRVCAELGILTRVVPLSQIPAQILEATRFRRLPEQIFCSRSAFPLRSSICLTPRSSASVENGFARHLLRLAPLALPSAPRIR